MNKRSILLTASALALSAGFSGGAYAAETIDYTYDAQGRLIKVERSGTVNNNVDTEYDFDDADNRTNEKTTGSPNATPPP